MRLTVQAIGKQFIIIYVLIAVLLHNCFTYITLSYRACNLWGTPTCRITRILEIERDSATEYLVIFRYSN